MNEALLPCPWCGDPVEGHVTEGTTFRWRKFTGCCTDGPEVRHDTTAADKDAAEIDSERRAIAAWNRRAALAAQHGAVGEHEALAERIREAHDLSLDGEHRECRTALLRIANALGIAPTAVEPAQRWPVSQDPLTQLQVAAIISDRDTPTGEQSSVVEPQDEDRYQLLRRGQHWSVIDGVGDVLRGDDLDAAIDSILAARASKGTPL